MRSADEIAAEIIRRSEGQSTLLLKAMIVEALNHAEVRGLQSGNLCCIPAPLLPLGKYVNLQAAKEKYDKTVSAMADVPRENHVIALAAAYCDGRSEGVVEAYLKTPTRFEVDRAAYLYATGDGKADFPDTAEQRAFTAGADWSARKCFG